MMLSEGLEHFVVCGTDQHRIGSQDRLGKHCLLILNCREEILEGVESAFEHIFEHQNNARSVH